MDQQGPSRLRALAGEDLGMGRDLALGGFLVFVFFNFYAIVQPYEKSKCQYFVMDLQYPRIF